MLPRASTWALARVEHKSGQVKLLPWASHELLSFFWRPPVSITWHISTEDEKFQLIFCQVIFGSNWNSLSSKDIGTLNVYSLNIGLLDYTSTIAVVDSSQAIFLPSFIARIRELLNKLLNVIATPNRRHSRAHSDSYSWETHANENEHFTRKKVR